MYLTIAWGRLMNNQLRNGQVIGIMCISLYHASRIMVCGEADGDINCGMEILIVEPALKDHHG